MKLYLYKNMSIVNYIYKKIYLPIYSKPYIYENIYVSHVFGVPSHSKH